MVFTGDDAETKAKAAAERLTQGAAFDLVSQEVTGRPPVDLGSVARAEVPLPELAEPAFTTAAGQTTAPVQTPLGWYILQVAKVDPAHSPTFEDVREQLSKELALHQATDAIVELGQKLEDELAGGASLEEAAQQLGVTPVKIEAVDQAGNDRAGKPVPDLSPEIIEAAFGTEQGQISPLGDTEEGGSFVLRVDSVTAAAVRPLAEVRDQVIAAWQAEERRKRAQAKAEAAAERLRKGDPVAAVAQENGATVATSQPFKRNAQEPAAHISRELAEKLFSVKEGEVVTAPAPEGEVVARLSKINPAEGPGDPVAEDELRREVRAQIEADLQAQFLDALREEVDVETNERLLDQLF
jgi:peptidyl-prolyl cis-trans isomerase D